ncbi:MAG: xanthine dehydrogenase family protein molybdopterin-binding subunit [Chloroflexi bacterium]|nr:xanthine dehydrogenase family protein molybdopterin-binding subunit [Chloroflexota bacterium]
MPQRSIDAFKVLSDYEYAATLTNEEWLSLSGNPEYHTLIADDPSLAEELIARFGMLVPGFSAALAAAASVPLTGFGPTVNRLAGRGGGSAAPSNAEFSIVGTSVPRTHGFGVVTGVGRYSENQTLPNMLFMKTLGSPYPHARIRSIDTSKAEALPGVHYILHRFNLPEGYQDVSLGSGPPFRYLFNEELIQVGAPVAVVAADSDHIGDEAIRQIQVDYEVLPAVVDFMEGTRPSTPKQWDNRLDGTILTIASPFVRGDVERGFAEADIVIENVTSMSTIQHAALELTTDLTWWSTEGARPQLTQIGPKRHAHGARSAIAQALKVDQSQVRVITPGYLGMSFGSFRDTDLPEIHSALLSWLTGRPIRFMSTRSEDMVTRTHRTQTRNESKIGVKRDGSITAFFTKKYGNAGAYRGGGGTGNSLGLAELYTIPNLRQENIDVFTNMYRYGSYRCTTHPNDTLAREPLIERAAYAINMNPLDFRLRNLSEVGNPETRRPFSNPGIRDTITQTAAAIGWREKWHAPKTREVRPGVFHGIGMACHECNHGAGGAPSTGSVVINADGTLTVVSGAAEVGPGERTVMAMIAAETLGIPMNRTRISPDVDSDFTADTGVTAGSRQTLSGGWGIHLAALDARAQLLDWGARKFVDDARVAGQTIQVSADQLDVRDGLVSFKDDPERRLPIAQVIAFASNPIIGRGAHIHPPTWERVAFATHAAEVEVDTVTGTISVTKYVAAHDVGRALNRMATEQQIEGGVIVGLGLALTEQLLVDGATGIPINDNILDYKVPTIKDVPEKIDVIMVENAKEYGVFGAHGIGEPPAALGFSVMVNAVYNAVGVWVEDMPLTREKVLNALKGR